MDVDTFIRNLEGEFDTPIPGGLRADTRFRDLGDWTSLQALIVVVSFERDYGITITTDELQQAATVADLYDAVRRRWAR